MKFKIVSPTRALVIDASQEEIEILKKDLTYTNTAAQYLVKRHYNNIWFKSKNLIGWEHQLDELKSQVKKTLVFTDENGQMYIRPGSIPYLESCEVENCVEYPVPKKVAWAKVPKYTLYPYQEESVKNLITEKHGAVSITTGGGKSLIILNLLRNLGLSAVVVVPSAGIFNELLEKMEEYFGKGKVGGYGDGKKKIGKLFTCAIAGSLVNLKEGTPAYDFFKTKKVFIADEAHTLPSETLEAVCHGVLADCEYRMFFSATHTRGDGSLKLLQSITGKVVNELSTSDAVAGGFICPHDFKIVKIASSNPNQVSPDGLLNKRIHFLRNRNIAVFSAKIANTMANRTNEQTLILVEELNQIAMILPLLKVPYAYAHSESNKIRLEEMGLEKVDVAESIDKFNKGEVKVLIGTSRIHVGVNIFPITNTINWIGGSSVIKTCQAAVGRSVRLGSHNPWAYNHKEKTKCTIWDFDVYDAPSIEHQLKARIECYMESKSKIYYVDLSKY